MFGSIIRIIKLAAGHKWKMIISIVSGVISGALFVVPFGIVYLVLIEIYKNPQDIDQRTVWKLVIVGLIVVVLKFVFMAISSALSHISAFDILYTVRVKISEKLATLPLGFFNKRTTGDIKRVMAEDVENMEISIAHNMPDVVTAITTPLVTIIYLFTIDWRMALATLVAVPFAFMALGVMYKDIGSMWKLYNESQEKVSSSIIEYVQGMAVVKAFNQTAGSFTKLKDAAEEYLEWETKFSRKSWPYWSAFLVLISAQILFILPIGAWLYIAGTLSIPTFMLFLLLGLGFTGPMLTLLFLSQMVGIITEGEKRIHAIMVEKSLPEPEVEKIPKAFDIEFHNVDFSYNEVKVLKDVSFKAHQGSITALVGPSGAGKTTIARLIPRFWDIDKGEILLGDVNIKEMKTQTLMSYVSFVFQDVVLFDDTIRGNIRMGKADATEEEIINAAKIAQCHDFISNFPEKYDTHIGELGGKLSGGERQRISIARAILKDAPVLVLDEATAFTDPENEDMIQEALSSLMKNKTVIIIAHRLSTITETDQIIVVNDGRIVDKGTHIELVEESKLYSGMWQAHTEALGWTF